jgi:Flp pilus assembly protein TadD
MRNIEEIAAEEELRFQLHTRKNLKRFLTLTSIILALVGWNIFSEGDMDRGAFWIVISFLSLLIGWGAYRVYPFPFFSWIGAFSTGGVAWVVYGLTQAPSFYWGKDPDFFLAVQSGAVTEPLWSPLTYLVVQAFQFFIPKNLFTLPTISVFLAGVSIFCLSLWWFSLFREKKLSDWGVGLVLGLVVVLCHPFWDAGTTASGAVFFLGLLLFSWLRLLERSAEPQSENLGMVAGLLWSVHPAWGLMGLLNLIINLDLKIENLKRFSIFFLLGLTPFFWIFFRALQYFPSWGGLNPFWEWLIELKGMALSHFQTDWNFLTSISLIGWVPVPVFLATVVILVFRITNKLTIPPLKEIVLTISALLIGLLFYSDSSDRIGPTMLWAIAGLVEILIAIGEKYHERKGAIFISPMVLAFVLAGCGMLSIACVFLPGQSCVRNAFLFPQQHALNILRSLDSKTILIFDDPFEANACRVAQTLEPLGFQTIFLDKQLLGQRWYLSQIISKDPWILFSKTNGSTEDVLQDIIANNKDRCNVQWAVSALPPSWIGYQAFPEILTQRFTSSKLLPEDVENVQFRYDFTDLVQQQNQKNLVTQRYYDRYVTGFNSLGQWLLANDQYSAAIRTFDRVLSLDPNNPDAKKYLSQIYTQDNLLEAARLDFEKIVKTYPAKIKQLMLAMDQQKIKKDNDAAVMDLANQTVQANARLADAQYHLGQLYERDGNFQKSKALLEDSVHLNPQSIETQMTLGFLMEKMGNDEEAEEAFRSVLKTDQQNKKAQTELWKLLNHS